MDLSNDMKQTESVQKKEQVISFSRKRFLVAILGGVLLIGAAIFISVKQDLYHEVKVAIQNKLYPPQLVVVTVKPRDSLSKIFHSLNLNTRDIRKILVYKDAKNIYNIRPGQKITFAINPKTHDWVKFSYPFNLIDSLVVTKNDGVFAARITHATPKIHLEYVAANMKGKNLLKGVKKAGLDSHLSRQLAYIFQNQVNFRARVHDGDKFALLYKVETVRGKKLPNRIMAVDLTYNKKDYKAVRFTNKHGYSTYYDSKGLALAPSFMRYPTHFVRISSKFSYHRWHPILHIYRPHLGVDFAGILGTPVTATGAGKIVFMRPDGGYGNMVMIRHSKKYTTVYAHLLKFHKGLHVGSYVKEGQVIAYLGSTGLSTGPHVHYEFRINGKQQDPLKVKLPRITWVAASERSKFLSEEQKLFAALDAHHGMEFAANI